MKSPIGLSYHEKGARIAFSGQSFLHRIQKEKEKATVGCYPVLVKLQS